MPARFGRPGDTDSSSGELGTLAVDQFVSAPPLVNAKLAQLLPAHNEASLNTSAATASRRNTTARPNE